MRNATRSNNTCPADESPLLVSSVMRFELCCFGRLLVLGRDEDMLMLLACRIRSNWIRGRDGGEIGSSSSSVILDATFHGFLLRINRLKGVDGPKRRARGKITVERDTA